MTDLPNHVDIHEEGPREGFQIEPGPISTADKIRLIEALAETGLHHIQAASFVSPKIVPGWADAEDVVSGFTPKEGVTYKALWFNAAGLNRALVFRNKLTITGSISLTASEGFTQKNLHRSHAENVEAMKKQTALYLENGVDVPRIGVMAAFGCNYQGDIAPAPAISMFAAAAPVNGSFERVAHDVAVAGHAVRIGAVVGFEGHRNLHRGIRR